MARVVCDELARQAYDSSTDVFVKRLIQLRELSEDWAEIDHVKGNNTAAAAAAASPDKKPTRESLTQENVNSGANDYSDNDDNDICDVSMVCDEIPSTSDYNRPERQARPVSRQLAFFVPYIVTLMLSHVFKCLNAVLRNRLNLLFVDVGTILFCTHF